MNGHMNYHVGQQIFYVYDSLFFKRLLNTKDDSFVTSNMASGRNNMTNHKFYSNKSTWNDARRTCVQKGDKENSSYHIYQAIVSHIK